MFNRVFKSNPLGLMLFSLCMLSMFVSIINFIFYLLGFVQLEGVLDLVTIGLQGCIIIAAFRHWYDYDKYLRKYKKQYKEEKEKHEESLKYLAKITGISEKEQADFKKFLDPVRTRIQMGVLFLLVMIMNAFFFINNIISYL